MSAQDIAHEFVSTAHAFVDTFVQQVAPDGSEGEMHRLQHKRRESCAALWAAVVATFEASALADQEKARIVPLVRQEMLWLWHKHCAGDPAFLYEITERSNYYLRHNDRTSQLATATHIVKELLDSIDPGADHAMATRRLAALMAHRMLADLQRLNEIKTHHPID